LKGIELRPLVFALGAGNAAILVNAHDLPAGPFGDLAEFALLVGGGLVEGRNPEVEDGALHDFPPFNTYAGGEPKKARFSRKQKG
jgi:hypothetical protein